ncbi:MAG: YHS domain-containing protein [Acidobacteriota bacterium]
MKEETNTAIDPVCNMTVNPQSAAGSHQHDGQTYYFCSSQCLHKFKADPQGYLNRATQPLPPSHAQ